jgi:hypothetical protein
MPSYIRWTEADITPMWPGISEEWTEVGDDGVVTRELGFDANGKVVHVFPSQRFPHGSYGHWDLAPIETSGRGGDIENCTPPLLRNGAGSPPSSPAWFSWRSRSLYSSSSQNSPIACSDRSGDIPGYWLVLGAARA